MPNDYYSLPKLFKEREIVIPIIQRDYAQGRDDKKAQDVRERLIDDWIHIFDSDSQRMDFNYIYGTESEEEKIFFPVDGQQRLTSLYLLYWYLAYRIEKTDAIQTWKISYKTRNSAAEFFVFIRDEECGKKLFNILLEGKDTIKKQGWFKKKWENDPTIQAAVNFLILLAEKFKGFDDEKMEKYWDVLNPEKVEDTKVIFKYLPEELPEGSAEIVAAKKYTRMNARGKKLTDFENLKAIIDEIEKNDKGTNYEISSCYDIFYIHQLFQMKKDKMPDGNLNDWVDQINKESFKLYKLIFGIYRLKEDGQGEICLSANQFFQEELYKISQKRDSNYSDNIADYLNMLKAVQELLYHSEMEVNYDADYFEKDSKLALAFVLFAKNMWIHVQTGEQEQIESNKKCFNEWFRFLAMLEDLLYKEYNNQCLMKLVDTLTSTIKQKRKTINDWFAETSIKDIEKIFKEAKVEISGNDLYCRILEQQIMAKLLQNNVIDKYEELDNISTGNHRKGYFFYLTGCINAWNDDNIPIVRNNLKDTILNYRSIIEPYKSIFPDACKGMVSDVEFLKAYAYASQCEIQNNTYQLKTGDKINNCDNKHIFVDKRLWNDDIFNKDNSGYSKCCEWEKELDDRLGIMKSTLEQVAAFRQANNPDIFNRFNESKKCWFENSQNTDYENCWLRLLYQSEQEDITKRILSSELKNENGEIVIERQDGDMPLWGMVYLGNNNFIKKEEINVDSFTSGEKYYSYYDKSKQMDIYIDNSMVLTFEVNEDAYTHPSNSNRNLYVTANKRNMDLIYKNSLDITWLSSSSGVNGFVSYERKDDESIQVRKYRKTGKNQSGKLNIVYEEIIIQLGSINTMSKQNNDWSRLFNEIYTTKNTDYGLWLDLWYDKQPEKNYFNAQKINNIIPRQLSNINIKPNIQIKKSAGVRPQISIEEKTKDDTIPSGNACTQAYI